MDHFWNLVPELLTADHDLDDKALSKAVLKKANLQGYQCGETKVSIWSALHAIASVVNKCFACICKRSEQKLTQTVYVWYRQEQAYRAALLESSSH